MNRNRPNRLLLPALIAGIVFALSACGGSTPSSPVPAAARSPLTTNPLPVVHSLDATPALTVSSGQDSMPAPGSELTSLAGNIACEALVTPDNAASFAGGRYKLTVPRGAVAQSTTIQCRYWKSGLLELQLLPHGEQFLHPITLEIDLHDTNADRSSPNYNGATPNFFWYDSSTDTWQEVPSVYSSDQNKLTVQLSHFSLYAVGGKAGW